MEERTEWHRTETAQSPVLKHGLLHPSILPPTHQSLAWRWFAGWTNSFAHSSTPLISAVLSAGFAVITFACNFNLTRNKLTHIQIIRYECGCVCVCCGGVVVSSGRFIYISLQGRVSLDVSSCGLFCVRSWPVKCVWVGETVLRPFIQFQFWWWRLSSSSRHGMLW